MIPLTLLLAAHASALVAHAGTGAYSRRCIATRARTSPATMQLPPGWVAHQDEQGQVYYCEEQSGRCQWDMPIYDDQQYQQTQEQYGDELSYEDQEVVAYISERLQEPQLRIAAAVVQFLGAETAYELLDQTEQVQRAGGMLVPDTGMPRTSGGVYLQLLKGATHLPPEAQDAALRQIKDKGKKVKSWDKASVQWS